MSGNECLLVCRHHALVWGTDLFNNPAQLVGHQRTGFKLSILLLAFYLSHLLFIPFFLLFPSPWGLFLFHFVFFVALLGISVLFCLALVSSHCFTVYIFTDQMIVCQMICATSYVV